MNKPIQLHESILGLSWDKDGKPYNYRTKHIITIDADDIIQITEYYDNKDPKMNFCNLLMNYAKFNKNNKIQVAESLEEINELISVAKQNQI